LDSFSLLNSSFDKRRYAATLYFTILLQLSIKFHKEDFAKMDSWQIIASDNPILKNGMRLALKNADFHYKIKEAKVGDVITLELAHGAKIDCVVRAE
jgi:hypothetical protein